MDKLLGKLNPLLRLAAISGVETAIKLHIRRGDNLDARDAEGATPLILAARKGRLRAVELLLDSGADATLTDLKGRDALACAKATGYTEIVALLAGAIVPVSESMETAREVIEIAIAREFSSPDAPVSGNQAFKGTCLEAERHTTSINDLSLGLPSPAVGAAKDSDELVSIEAAEACDSMQVFVGSVSNQAPMVSDAIVERANTLLFDGVLLDSGGEWEAEEECTAPENDYTLIDAMNLVHEAIAKHKVVDRDSTWEDVDLYLPEKVVPISRHEKAGEIRTLLLVALREGWVFEELLIAMCSDANGERSAESERLLSFAVTELGAEVVGWEGGDESPLDDPSLEEENLLSETLEFIEDLGSFRNDPSTFYFREIRGALLDAKEEIFLSREMEEGGRAALAALARWPSGRTALFEIADEAARREASACSVNNVSDSPVEEGSAFESEDDDEEVDGNTDSLLVTLAATRTAGKDVTPVIETLNLNRLSCGFVSRLVKLAQTDPEGHDFAKAVRRQIDARERMIICNLRLALSIAKRYLGSGLLLDDLIQEANIGLMKAVERYEWRKGFRFSTYATWWIRQQVTRCIANTARVVRAPVHMQEHARKVIRHRKEVEARVGRRETEFETAARLGLPISKAALLLSIFEEPIYLDDPECEAEFQTGDSFIAPESSDPATIADQFSLRSTLLCMLDDLGERDREVIIKRFGLRDGSEMTLEEVGRQFGVTRERIRQIESKGLKWLAHDSRKMILAPFMGDAYMSGSPSGAGEVSAEPAVAQRSSGTARFEPQFDTTAHRRSDDFATDISLRASAAFSEVSS